MTMFEMLTKRPEIKQRLIARHTFALSVARSADKPRVHHDVAVSLERSLKENARTWAELAKY